MSMSTVRVLGRVSIAMLLSGVLTVTALAPVQAAPQVAIDDPFVPQILPPVDSTPAVVVPEPLPKGDFSLDAGDASDWELAAPARGVKSFGSRADARVDLSGVDVDSLPVSARDEFTTTYTLPGGSPVMAIGESPLNVEIGGDWVPVDTGLDHVSGGWVDAEHPLSPEFAPRAGGDVVTLNNDGYQVSWRLLGAADVAGSTPKARQDPASQVTYPGVLDGVDLHYQVQPSLVKEGMVLDAAPDSAPAYQWVLSAPGMTVQADDAGGFVVLDPSGEVRFTIPTPTMWDSSGVAGVRDRSLRRLVRVLRRLAMSGC